MEAGEARRSRFRDIRRLFSNQAVSMLVILIGMWLVLSRLSPYFLTVGNISEITLQTAVIGIIAAGETLIIISGGIDLSVGSMFACSGVVGGLAFQGTNNLFVALFATILFGGALGLVNGFVITGLRVPPFIATLGMLGMARGLALIFSRGIPIFGLDQRYLWIGQGKIANVIPIPTIILLVVFGVVFISSDIDEILEIADRIVVMSNYRVVAELKAGEANKQAIMELAMGRMSDRN